MGLVKAGKKQALPSAPAEVEAGDPLAMLGDADPAQRRRAAHALAGRAEAVQPLCARLAAEPDPAAREAILTALVRTGTAEAVAGLLPFLHSEDASLRNGALESLQQMPPAIVGPEVEPLLADEDPDVRIFAAQLAGRIVHPMRLAWLAELVERDPHVNVCLTAVDALVETGDPQALDSLERLAGRFPDDPFVAFSVEAARRRFHEN
ncbi:HEAT repeat domain-containing protein [Azospirillum sp. SYSU D00513]|uniref:HEAT repeat domain-containing protein n=1 Tax=Azospirillum sp. SYSU D00513 TaxID=2812561 RepID=UPI001A95642C|nr:HEAT repeat domain-containing protein [Azospirillum sp. SYSU D00513]